MLIHKLFSLAGNLLGKNKLSIMIYHQVFAECDPMRPSVPDAKTFKWQMELVKKYCQPMSISAALQHLDQGSLPNNAVCITFDDGYLNNLQVAAPILKELGIPATVYVATAFSHGDNMWNDRLTDLVETPSLQSLELSLLSEENIVLTDINSRIKATHFLISKIKYLPIQERISLIDKLYEQHEVKERPAKMMTPEQIKQLESFDIDVGAHTVDHPIMKVLDIDAQQQQLIDSKTMLEKWLGHSVKGFAYPNGKWNVDYDINTRDLVAEAGFDYAVSTNWGITDKGADKYQLNRFTPWDTSPIKFHIRLLRNLISLG